MQRKTSHLKSVRGFTLIEMLMVLVISSLVIGGAYTMFINYANFTVYVDNKNDLSSNVNIAFRLMADDIRFSGYNIPAPSAIAPINNIDPTNSTPGFDGNFFNNPGTFLNEVKPGTDALMVLRKDDFCTEPTFAFPSVLFTNAGTGTGATICQPSCFTAATGAYSVGDVAMVLGEDGGIFVQFTQIQTGVGPTTGVCSDQVYTTVNWQGLGEYNLPIRNRAGAGDPGANQAILRLASHHIYFVNNDSELARWEISGTPGAQIIGEGVEDMQLVYNAKTACDVYWTGICGTGCSNCNGPNTDYPDPADVLSEIRSVRINMVVRQNKEDPVNFHNKGFVITPFFDHTPAASTDSFRRTVVGQLVPVINLTLLDFQG